MKPRRSYRSVYVIGENYISMSHFSCFVASVTPSAESAVLLGGTRRAPDSSVSGELSGLLLKVSAPATLTLCRGPRRFSACKQSPSWRRETGLRFQTETSEGTGDLCGDLLCMTAFNLLTTLEDPTY